MNNETSQIQIDLSELHESVAGDLSLIQELIEDLLKVYPEQLESLKQSILEGIHEEIMSKAHDFKGQISNYGIRNATELAYQLEKMGREGKLEEAQSVFKRLQEEMEKANTYFLTSNWKDKI